MDMPSAQQAIASNKDAWDESARLHKDTDTWRTLLASVAEPDFSCLDPTLTALLQDVGVAGKDVVQLCCNNGRESLSLFGLGARTVVGVDQSRAFLDQARELAALSPYSPEFIETEIHHLPERLHARFDIALVTIGVLPVRTSSVSLLCCKSRSSMKGRAQSRGRRPTGLYTRWAVWSAQRLRRGCRSLICKSTRIQIAKNSTTSTRIRRPSCRCVLP